MIRIHAERDSVCMGDDVTAPNAGNFFFLINRNTDALAESLAGYVPPMKNVVWEIICGQHTIGYLFSDETGKYQYELTASPGRLSDLPSHTVYCRYHHAGLVNSDDCFPEGTSLPERVKTSKHH